MDPTHTSPICDDTTRPENELGHRRRVKDLSEQIADLFKDIGERMLELRGLGVPTAEWTDLMMRHFSQATQDQFGDSSTLAALFDMVAAFLDKGDIPTMDAVAPVALKLGGSMKGGNWMGILEAGLPLLLKLFGNSTGTVQAGPPPGLQFETEEEWRAHHEKLMLESHTPETSRMIKVIKRLFAEAPKLTDASGKHVEGQAPALECFVTLKAGAQVNGALSVTPEGGLRMLAPNQIPAAERGGVPKMVMIEHFFDYDQVANIALLREVKASEPSRIVTAS